MRIRRLAPLVIAVALVSSACGDSTGPQVELSDAEIGQLFAAINGIFTDVVGNFSVANPALNFSLMGVSDVIDLTVTCDGGGTAAVTGEENSTGTSFDFDADIDFTDCVSEGFTLGGGLNFSGAGTATETSVTLEMTIDGDLLVETGDGRAGTCTMDLSYDLELTGTTLNLTTSGKVCGKSFSQSL